MSHFFISLKELIPVILDDADLKDAIWQIILNTRHYAKRQVTWLKTEPKTIWLSETGESRFERAMTLIETFLTEGTKEA